jgi:nicotinate-nucleotide adenylyltransferase
VSRERLGIMGGTFDPVHIAHLFAAVEARCSLALDRTLFVVAGDPWQKSGQVVAPAEARFEMVSAAIAELPGMEASRLEIDRDGPTYTIDTVDALSTPARELFLIVGSDVAAQVNTWHRAEELRERVTLAVLTREGSPHGAPPGWNVTGIEMPRLDISSSEIRERCANGHPIDVLVPAPAVRVLRAYGLYTRH